MARWGLICQWTPFYFRRSYFAFCIQSRSFSFSVSLLRLIRIIFGNGFRNLVVIKLCALFDSPYDDHSINAILVIATHAISFVVVVSFIYLFIYCYFRPARIQLPRTPCNNHFAQMHFCDVHNRIFMGLLCCSIRYWCSFVGKSITFF